MNRITKITRKGIRGFTLVEMMLYVGISSLFLVTLALFFSFLLSSRVKNQTINEVNQQGLYVMDFITQSVRNARGVTVPTIGTASSTLSLTVASSTLSPVIFDVSNGVLRSKEGVGSYLPLTNGRVKVSEIVFQNVSASSTDGGTVSVHFTLTYMSSSTQHEYVYSKTFTGGASFH
ncbi:MAG: hypothetical protein RLZZ308_608 [Candidatus Parcubacteria bacterium]|jgi:Tfp pilus assembly protein PilW